MINDLVKTIENLFKLHVVNGIDGGDDDELGIVFVVWLTKERCLAFLHPGLFPEILTITNLWHAASRV